jgi:hypothetical protein
LKNTIKESKKAIPISNLIPKPSGQAGRGNGYTLLPELKLPKPRGRRILVSFWPAVNICVYFIDFESVPGRIMKLKNEIRGLLENEIILGTSFAWKVFVNDVTRKDVSTSFADFALSSEAIRLPIAGEGKNKHAG